MYFVDSLNVLLRRWYVVVAGLLLMVGGAVAVFAYVPTTYQSSGQLILLLPAASDTGKPVNPYLNLQAGLTTAASLVSGSITTKDVQRELDGQGFSAKYSVAVVPGTGPLVTVTAKDNDPAMAVATRDEVMDRFAKELQRIQDEVQVPQAQYMGVTSSSVTSGAEALPGNKLRALVGVAALGGILTLASAFAVDRVARRRSLSEITNRTSTAVEPPLDSRGAEFVPTPKIRRLTKIKMTSVHEAPRRAEGETEPDVGVPGTEQPVDSATTAAEDSNAEAKKSTEVRDSTEDDASVKADRSPKSPGSRPTSSFSSADRRGLAMRRGSDLRTSWSPGTGR